MNALRIASMLIGPAPDARMTLCTKRNPTPARGGASVLGVCPRIHRSRREISFEPEAQTLDLGRRLAPPQIDSLACSKCGAVRARPAWAAPLSVRNLQLF